MSGQLKFAIRSDDPPWSDEVEEIENLAKVARRHNCPLTLAIPSGWLRELPHLHAKYKKFYKEGLIKIACHGMYHEDFTGLGRRGATRLGKPFIIRGVNLQEADKVLEECQDFAKSFFGMKYRLFIPPGRFFSPVPSNEFYDLLIKRGFNIIAGNPNKDPLADVFERVKGLYEVSSTIDVDFYTRKGNRGVSYTPEKFDQYLEATKDHIRTRFRYGLYVCVGVHAINFDKSPQPEYGFAGDNPGGLYLDKLLKWVTSEYPKVKFAGMDELVPRASS